MLVTPVSLGVTVAGKNAATKQFNRPEELRTYDATPRGCSCFFFHSAPVPASFFDGKTFLRQRHVDSAQRLAQPSGPSTPIADMSV